MAKMAKHGAKPTRTKTVGGSAREHKPLQTAHWSADGNKAQRMTSIHKFW
jgi:hypothetical protein